MSTRKNKETFMGWIIVRGTDVKNRRKNLDSADIIKVCVDTQGATIFTNVPRVFFSEEEDVMENVLRSLRRKFPGEDYAALKVYGPVE